MLKNALTFIAATCISASSFAAVETFDSAASAATNGFTLGADVLYHDAGRPYLENFGQNHSITYSGSFTFNSLDFNYDPWQGYNGGNNGLLHMELLDSSNNILLDTVLTIPTDRSWLTYANTVENVHQIWFEATGYSTFNPGAGFWPSVDNLVYNNVANGNPNNVPEPTSLALLGLGLAGLAAARRRTNSASN